VIVSTSYFGYKLPLQCQMPSNKAKNSGL